METNRTTAAESTLTTPAICRTGADPGPCRPDRHSVRAAQRHPLADVAAGDGVRVGHYLLASTRSLAARGRLETTPCCAARRATATGAPRFGASGRRQRLAPRDARGKKTGPNPTDRRKAGSKHHVLTDADGVPLVATLTAANRPDITQLLTLVDTMPPIGGRPGRPRRKPRAVQGDRGYDSARHRDQLRQRGITPVLADWTDNNDVIKRQLEELNSKSIPLLAIYPANRPGDVIVLRDTITQRQLLEALEKAGPSDGLDAEKHQVSSTKIETGPTTQ